MDADDLVFVEFGPSMSPVSCSEQCQKHRKSSYLPQVTPNSSHAAITYASSIGQPHDDCDWQATAHTPTQKLQLPTSLPNEIPQYRQLSGADGCNRSQVKLPETRHCESGNQPNQEPITAIPSNVLAQRMKISSTVPRGSIPQDEAPVSDHIPFAVDAKY